MVRSPPVSQARQDDPTWIRSGSPDRPLGGPFHVRGLVESKAERAPHAQNPAPHLG
jgi:hypothetical protein